MEYVDNWVMLWRLLNAVGAVLAVPVLWYIARREQPGQPQSELFWTVIMFIFGLVVGSLYSIGKGTAFNPSIPIFSVAIAGVYVSGWRTRQRSRGPRKDR